MVKEDKKEKKIVYEVLEFDCEWAYRRVPIDKIIEDVNKLKEKGCTYIHFDGETDIKIDAYIQREETDDEQKLRLERENQKELQLKENELKELQRLKDKYEK